MPPIPRRRERPEELRDHVAVQGAKFNDLMASYKQSNLRANPQLVPLRG
jgi:hypothetical protein